MFESVNADHADENGFLFPNAELSTTCRAEAWRRRISSQPSTISRPTLLAFDGDAEAWLVGCERRQEMRQQLIAAALADDSG
jgi:hypothetical protein